MTPASVARTVLFADLRGSTALYEKLGNAEAAVVVTQSVALLGQVVLNNGGRVVKTLGDGLMAVFSAADKGLSTADEMHESLERIGADAREGPVLRLKVSVAVGELVDVDGDCFGDAVNVAARVLDLAGDDETLCTESFLRALPAALHHRFRGLDRIHLRGRQEPVGVFRLEPRSFSDSLSTVLDAGQGLLGTGMGAPDGIRLTWRGQSRVFAGSHLPAVIGRSPHSTFFVDDSRVSRSHAKLDWHSGSFQLTDLSSNGTFVQFQDMSEAVALRRGNCTLHGSGRLWLGAPPHINTINEPPVIGFEVMPFNDIVPVSTR